MTITAEIMERIHLILDSATEAICGCDSEGTCLFSNLSAARILGYDDPTELLGKSMFRIHFTVRSSRDSHRPSPLNLQNSALNKSLKISTRLFMYLKGLSLLTVLG